MLLLLLEASLPKTEVLNQSRATKHLDLKDKPMFNIADFQKRKVKEPERDILDQLPQDKSAMARSDPT
ncbi:hypothetical protein WICPIJ_008468 [Wickerhamomyces pijperi]|uniref:Uncharacterized protein n=1 Tax=Wickerhamomyces pijperi TaxID=599730 RepID=A0A9P8PYL9_WICPI|nr:hypothetical protein WICPIJ_008468 [Wickerhamomyces pijperi]